jgi:hypothetical protein
VKLTRRSFVDKAVKSSLLCLTYNIGGVSLLMTPEEARAQGMPLKKLSEQQARQLDILAEALVPTSSKLGVVQFVDHQLNEDPNEALLIAKYFGIAPPYVNFYAKGLEVAAGVAQSTLGKPLEELNADELVTLIRTIAPAETIVDGFPIFLFNMCLRSDAVDVVYGTPAGFERLNVPYMQHILPPEKWDA